MAIPDRVLLDTNCFIYLLEDPTSARGRFLSTSLFEPALAGRRQLFAATLTVTELLSQPRGRHPSLRAAELVAALEAMPGLSLLPLTVGVAARAGRLRGETGLSVPDAIVLATAVDCKASLVTNDRRLVAAPTTSEVLLLDDLVRSG